MRSSGGAGAGEIRHAGACGSTAPRWHCREPAKKPQSRSMGACAGSCPPANCDISEHHHQTDVKRGKGRLGRVGAHVLAGTEEARETPQTVRRRRGAVMGSKTTENTRETGKTRPSHARLEAHAAGRPLVLHDGRRGWRRSRVLTVGCGRSPAAGVCETRQTVNPCGRLFYCCWRLPREIRPCKSPWLLGNGGMGSLVHPLPSRGWNLPYSLHINLNLTYQLSSTLYAIFRKFPTSVTMYARFASLCYETAAVRLRNPVHVSK